MNIVLYLLASIGVMVVTACLATIAYIMLQMYWSKKP